MKLSMRILLIAYMVSNLLVLSRSRATKMTFEQAKQSLLQGTLYIAPRPDLTHLKPEEKNSLMSIQAEQDLYPHPYILQANGTFIPNPLPRQRYQQWQEHQRVSSQKRYDRFRKWLLTDMSQLTEPRQEQGQIYLYPSGEFNPNQYQGRPDPLPLSLSFLWTPPMMNLRDEKAMPRRAMSKMLIALHQMLMQPLNTQTNPATSINQFYINPLLEDIIEYGDPVLAALANGVLARQGQAAALARRKQLWERAQGLSLYLHAGRVIKRAAEINTPDIHMSPEKRSHPMQTLDALASDNNTVAALRVLKEQWRPNGLIVNTRLQYHRNHNTTRISRSISHQTTHVQVSQETPTYNVDGTATVYVGNDALSPPTTVVRGKTQKSGQSGQGPTLSEPDDVQPDFMPLKKEITGLGHYLNEFEAYDCSTPINLQTVRLPEEEDCQDRRASPITSTRNVTYYLLQKSEFYELPVRRCQRYITRLPFQCAMFDHVTPSTLDFIIKYPQPVTEWECQNMWETGKVQVKRRPEASILLDEEFELNRPGHTQLNYELVGKTYWNNGEIECEGTKYYSKAQQAVMTSMTVFAKDDIELSEDTLRIDQEGHMSTVITEDAFPTECDVRRGVCTTGTGTYIWDPPQGAQSCTVHKLRLVEGEEIMVTDGTKLTTIVTDNHAMIRMVVTSSTYLCDVPVLSTNFEQLYLIDMAPPHGALPAEFNHELPDAAKSLALYFNQQSGWLHGAFAGQLHDYVHELLVKKCEEERITNQNQYAALAAHQKSMTEGTTVRLDPGVFATATGEVWKRYQCRPIVVIGENKPRCYDALPVRILPNDLLRISMIYNITEETQFYMEPGSRRITMAATEVPCTSHFAPLYQTRQKMWVQVMPAIVPARRPETIAQVEDSPYSQTYAVLLAGPDFQAGGIYTKEQIQRMEKFQRMHRVRERVLAKLVTATGEDRTAQIDEGLSLTDSLFEQAGVPNILDVGALFTKIWSFLKDYGAVASGILSLVLAYRFVVALFKMCYHGMYPDHGYSNGWMICLGACCPYGIRLIFDTFHRLGRRRIRRHERESDATYFRIQNREECQEGNNTDTRSPRQVVRTSSSRPLPSVPEEKLTMGMTGKTRNEDEDALAGPGFNDPLLRHCPQPTAPSNDSAYHDSGSNKGLDEMSLASTTRSIIRTGTPMPFSFTTLRRQVQKMAGAVRKEDAYHVDAQLTKVTNTPIMDSTHASREGTTLINEGDVASGECEQQKGEPQKPTKPQTPPLSSSPQNPPPNIPEEKKDEKQTNKQTDDQ